MAWPCITRACCINRFWSELDKGDIAVPLVFTKYSDVAGGDVQHFPIHHHPQPRPKRSGPVAIATQPPLGGEDHQAPPPPPPGGGGGSASVTRQDYQAWKVRPEPSCKPRNEYHPCTGPFNTETQYQKDYKPWPIPKKGDHPWIPKPSPSPTSTAPAPGGRKANAGSKKEHAAAEADSGVEKSEIEEKVQEKECKEVRAAR